jgi:protein involved in ribonucleotide reduction
MKGWIVVGVVAVGATVWYKKFASQADRSNTQCVVEMLTGYRMPGHYLRG